MQFRTERDPLGESAVPADAYYGIQTARAVANFPISGLRAPADLVTATILVKKAAAQANVALGRLDARIGDAIVRAADEVLGGALARPVRRRCLPGRRRHVAQHERERSARQPRRRDPWRRARRVPARASERSRQHGTVHQRRVPDGDAARAAARRMRALVESARALAASLAQKAEAFDSDAQGRPHAPAGRGADDARPGVRRLRRVPRPRARTRSTTPPSGLEELNLGATAVGTGLNAGEEYASLAIRNLSRATGPPRSSRPQIGFASRKAWGTCSATRAPCAGLPWNSARSPPTCGFSAWDRAPALRDCAAGGAARIVDHAGQSESVGAGNGEPGVLPGDGLRRDDCRRLRKPGNSS